MSRLAQNYTCQIQDANLLTKLNSCARHVEKTYAVGGWFFCRLTPLFTHQPPGARRAHACACSCLSSTRPCGARASRAPAGARRSPPRSPSASPGARKGRSKARARRTLDQEPCKAPRGPRGQGQHSPVMDGHGSKRQSARRAKVGKQIGPMGPMASRLSQKSSSPSEPASAKELSSESASPLDDAGRGASAGARALLQTRMAPLPPPGGHQAGVTICFSNVCVCVWLRG